MQNSPNSNQSITIVIQGTEVTVGNITQIINSRQKQELTFDLLIEIVSKKYTFLEKLPTFEVENLWKLLTKENQTKLQPAEVKILQLAVRYCCFFERNWNDPVAKKKLNSQYFCSQFND